MKNKLSRATRKARRARQDRQARALVSAFEAVRTKLAETPHRVSGKRPNWSASAKAYRDQNNLALMRADNPRPKGRGSAAHLFTRNWYPGDGRI